MQKPIHETTTWSFPRRMTEINHRTGEGTKSEMLANGSIRIIATWDKRTEKWIDVDAK